MAAWSLTVRPAQSTIRERIRNKEKGAQESQKNGDENGSNVHSCQGGGESKYIKLFRI